MTVRRSLHVYARCPECGGSRATTVDDRGRDVFPVHMYPMQTTQGRSPGLPAFSPCTGSGWLVEDEDRVTGRWPR